MTFRGGLLRLTCESGCACADPDNWGIAASSAVDFMNSYISSRAAIAAQIGKPFVLEEFGMDVRPCLTFTSHNLLNCLYWALHRTSACHPRALDRYKDGRLCMQGCGCA